MRERFRCNTGLLPCTGSPGSRKNPGQHLSNAVSQLSEITAQLVQDRSRGAFLLLRNSQRHGVNLGRRRLLRGLERIQDEPIERIGLTRGLRRREAPRVARSGDRISRRRVLGGLAGYARQNGPVRIRGRSNGRGLAFGTRRRIGKSGR